MLTATPLSTIIALARAGALDHAWGQFCVGGYDRMEEDPAALTVKGRLLKDQAQRATGEARRAFYLQSADAYQRSAALQPATYPLINAATLALLSGDRARAEAAAREVLERIAAEPDEPETPYYRAATEAEALLLLGRRDEAEAALAAAVAAAPRAWEDHASTLRQFLIIQDVLGGETGWLDRLRPPNSLHYAAPASADDEVAALGATIGFGFGGLAAGRELATAEALLAAGAELHVILPGDAEHFAARFVDPFGSGWRARFDAALAEADSLRLVRPLGRAPDAAMSALAGRIAAGAALLNAERLMGAASGEGAAPDPPDEGLALLAIGAGDGGDGFEDQLRRIQGALREGGAPVVPPHLAGELVLTGYAGPRRAAAAARALHTRLAGTVPLRIAGHYGLIECVSDPFSGTARPRGSGADIVETIAAATPPGSICVSDDFAAALATSPDGPGGAHWIGELKAFDGGSAIGLYALSGS
jgi:hypothetical protein